MRHDRPKERTILVVTRIVQRKGVQHVLEAVEGWGPEWTLHVVGDGPYARSVREQAASRSIPAVFHGWLDNDSRELRELYETAGIFVMASESENFPVSLLEAMSAGAAIATTSGTGCAEVVGGAALLFPPRDVRALRAALTRLAGDPDLRALLGRAARRRLQAELSWEAVTARYLAAYGEVVGRRRERVGTLRGVQPSARS